MKSLTKIASAVLLFAAATTAPLIAAIVRVDDPPPPAKCKGCADAGTVPSQTPMKTFTFSDGGTPTPMTYKVRMGLQIDWNPPVIDSTHCTKSTDEDCSEKKCKTNAKAKMFIEGVDGNPIPPELNNILVAAYNTDGRLGLPVDIYDGIHGLWNPPTGELEAGCNNSNQAHTWVLDVVGSSLPDNWTYTIEGDSPPTATLTMKCARCVRNTPPPPPPQ